MSTSTIERMPILGSLGHNPRNPLIIKPLDPALVAAERVTEQGHGRQPAICELTCPNCGDGLRFDQRQCETCGAGNPRYGA